MTSSSSFQPDAGNLHRAIIEQAQDVARRVGTETQPV